MAKVNWGHVVCPLYRGGPYFESPFWEVPLYMYKVLQLQSDIKSRVVLHTSYI